MGLDLTVYERGPRTTLRQGGSPLNTVDRHKLALARAIYGTPPLLLVQDVDGHLDSQGVDRLKQIIEGYPGVVLFTSSDWFAQQLNARQYTVGLAATAS